MNDETELLSHVIAVLEEMEVPYMIGGSVALSIWAQPRLTHDLDLVVDLPDDRIHEFCRHFSADRFFIDPEAMNRAFAARNSRSLGMYSFIVRTGRQILIT